MFYLNSTLIPLVMVFQLEVYYKVDRLLNGLTAQPNETTAQWYSNKTSLYAYDAVDADIPVANVRSTSCSLFFVLNTGSSPSSSP